jgi:hypothetical protein
MEGTAVDAVLIGPSGKETALTMEPVSPGLLRGSFNPEKRVYMLPAYP